MLLNYFLPLSHHSAIANEYKSRILRTSEFSATPWSVRASPGNSVTTRKQISTKVQYLWERNDKKWFWNMLHVPRKERLGALRARDRRWKRDAREGAAERARGPVCRSVVNSRGGEMGPIAQQGLPRVRVWSQTPALVQVGARTRQGRWPLQQVTAFLPFLKHTAAADRIARAGGPSAAACVN
jgi:hypothetical protein